MIPRRRRMRAWCLMLLGVIGLADNLTAQALRLVGRTDLGGAGLNGDVAVVGTTAIVGAGLLPAAGVHAHLYNPYPCAAVTVKVVDLTRPAAPVVVATIPVPAGVAANGVAAARVRTPAFTGDLAAIALAACGTEGATTERGVVYYDVSKPAQPRFLGRYQADADSILPDSVPRCGPPPALSGERCASSQHSVSLMQRTDGRVFSLSLEPGASASKLPSGDLRVVDVTDPRRPVQVGAFPPPGEPIFSTNGCRPFRAGHGAGFSADGMRGLLAFYDGGLFIVDLAGTGGVAPLGQFHYPADRGFEGSAAYVASATVNGRQLALISEADFIAPTTTLEVRHPASVAGSKFACEAIFTLYDPLNAAQIYRHPGGRIEGELVYIGRGCPAGGMTGMDAGMHPGMASTEADPSLADARGKIVLLDRGRQPTQPGLPTGTGCSVTARVRAAEEAGAIGVVIAQTSGTAPEAFSPDGDPAGLSIPALQIDKGDGDALRAVLCPSVDDHGQCVGGQSVTTAMVDAPGEWGALRVVDVSDPAEPRELGVHRTPRSRRYPPVDLSVFSPQKAAVRGTLAFVPWNSDGVRVIDLAAGAPREVESFVPADLPDPTGLLPAKAYVVGVALFTPPSGTNRPSDGLFVVVSDVNSGLYVLDATAVVRAHLPSRDNAKRRTE